MMAAMIAAVAVGISLPYPADAGVKALNVYYVKLARRWIRGWWQVWKHRNNPMRYPFLNRFDAIVKVDFLTSENCGRYY